VRIAPRRWRLRPIVEAELVRLSHFDALAEGVLATARTAIRPYEGSGPLPITLRDDLVAIGAALRRLANTEQPWPKGALEDVRATAERIATSETIDRDAVIGSLLQTSALDLGAAVPGDRMLKSNKLRTSGSGKAAKTIAP
jgi:hypothetical protein